MLSSLVATPYNINASLEHTRLISGILEFAISLHVIITSLPTSPTALKIADIDGGTGRFGKSPPPPELQTQTPTL